MEPSQVPAQLPRIKSNLTNIQNVLQWGLRQKQPTLRSSTYCWQYYPVSDPEALASQVVELFKDFDDPDLKYYYQEVKNDLGGQQICAKSYPWQLKLVTAGNIVKD
ncbi:hypothetical protein B0H14DRAFT_2627878 [Mycena olivaceomarginata]|nr:hypothetical protein B0H14DRAFT_2627878 [Mycena olivaceomarginata]